ncbi:hypothetical protein AMTR_s00019p00179680 [Amborella trichopoda]|uniref:Uncharacterized protein n=2 Tax=Amborella trichopoda TaxID=13333 RepID=W1PHY3_AMBTC|nr:hypothetical protein AMTR_s00019p00179680 [Amborella trichopoda]
MANQSKWQRIKAMAWRFDEKELLWHVFQRRESRNREMELDRDGRPIATDSASSFYMDGEVHFTDDNIRCCSASDSGDDSPAAVPTSTMEEGHTNAQGMCGPFP